MKTQAAAVSFAARRHEYIMPHPTDPTLLTRLVHFAADPALASLVLTLGFIGSGLVLGVMGARVVRLSLVLAGAGFGACVGALLPQAMQWNMEPLVPAVIGLVAGATIGSLSFRFAAGFLACSAAAIVLGAGLIALHPQTGWPTPNDAEAAESLTLPDLDQTMAASGVDVTQWPIAEVIVRMTTSLLPTLEDLGARGRAVWLLAVIVAGSIGLGLGLVTPRRSVAAATAVLGAGLMVIGLGAVAMAEETTWAIDSLDRPTDWIGVWLGLALMGAMIQWSQRSRRADNPPRAALD